MRVHVSGGGGGVARCKSLPSCVMEQAPTTKCVMLVLDSMQDWHELFTVRLLVMCRGNECGAVCEGPCGSWLSSFAIRY
jgi:hypothetical protein